MRPPLPEIYPAKSSPKVNMAVLWMKIVLGIHTFLLLVLLPFESFFIREDSDVPAWKLQILAASVLVIYAAIATSLWRGFKWSRWAMLLFLLSAIIWYFIGPGGGLTTVPELKKISNVESVRCSFCLLFILLLPGVTPHFKRS